MSEYDEFKQQQRHDKIVATVLAVMWGTVLLFALAAVNGLVKW